MGRAHVRRCRQFTYFIDEEVGEGNADKTRSRPDEEHLWAKTSLARSLVNQVGRSISNAFVTVGLLASV